MGTTNDGAEGFVHRVRQGETTEGLADAHGHFWETLWEHPRNAALRALRRDPNILAEGDELFVPPRRPRVERCDTTRVHTFRRKGVPSRFELRCLDLRGEPRAGEPYTLRGDDGFAREGALDGDGWLKVSVPPSTRTIELTLGDGDAPETMTLRVGHLDPADSLSGVCDRLYNLGYYDGPTLDAPDEVLARAVRAFRRDEGLPASAEVDDALRGALTRRHGS